MSESKPIRIGMVVFPMLTNLDFAGPLEVFSKLRGVEVDIVWKDRDLVETEGLSVIRPTTTFAECANVDVIFVPGGPGQTDIMLDDEVISFVARQGAQAKWVTAMCTGSLVLGASGLLQGFRAATHWMSMDRLQLFGATPVSERVVFDRNRVTGGGVTAGIDFGFALAARLKGEPIARRLQLAHEYAPDPRSIRVCRQRSNPSSLRNCSIWPDRCCGDVRRYPNVPRPSLWSYKETSCMPEFDAMHNYLFTLSKTRHRD